MHFMDYILAPFLLAWVRERFMSSKRLCWELWGIHGKRSSGCLCNEEGNHAGLCVSPLALTESLKDPYFYVWLAHADMIYSYTDVHVSFHLKEIITVNMTVWTNPCCHVVLLSHYEILFTDFLVCATILGNFIICIRKSFITPCCVSLFVQVTDLLR